MITRRVLLLTGAGAVVVSGAAALRITGRDDDLLRAAGAQPHREPDPGDRRILLRARRRQEQLTALLAATGPTATLRETALGQLDALGGSVPTATATQAEPDAVVEAFSSASDEAWRDSLEVDDAALATVLASIGAGRLEIALAAGRLG